MPRRASAFLVPVMLMIILVVSSIHSAFLTSTAHPILGFRATHGSVTLTIYQNQDLALIEDERVLELLRGVYELPVQGVADFLIATSLDVQTPDNPDGISVDEVRFLGRPLAPDQLLEDQLGQEIEVYADGGLGTYRGRLLSTDGGILLEDSSGQFHLIRDASRYTIGTPDFIEPTLLWRIRSTLQGPSLVKFRYLTRSIDWDVEYSAVLNEALKELSFKSWVSIRNNSGLEFTLPEVRLIAGELNRVNQFQEEFGRFGADAPVASAAPNISVQQSFEYYEYGIGNPTTIHSNASTELAFLQSVGIPYEKRYIYEPQMRDGVGVWIEFENSGDEAKPLPAGLVRLYEDADAGIGLIGEDRINHTPVDERVQLLSGQAFDLVGERIFVNQQRPEDRVFRDTIRINLTNRKDEAVEISVIEQLQGDWKITTESHEHSRLDAHRAQFDVTLAPNEETTIEYTVEYHY